MSESTTPAQCNDADWKLARKCGLFTTTPGTNTWDAALGRFAAAIRASMTPTATINPPPASERGAADELVNALSKIIHDHTVAIQSAWIEWQHGKGAEDAMEWIHNTLCGPGHIPDVDAPYGKEAQAWFDANKSDPFPQCFCGRPSNILWMKQGFCCHAHCDEKKAALRASQEAAAK